MLKYFLVLIALFVGCNNNQEKTPTNITPKSIKTVDLKQRQKPEVINGHTLPPEPDEALNNSTLLGIDSNNNGVRDDVERWIYHTYKHPIEIGIFMQNARAYQRVIVDPSRAKETMKYITSSAHCESYWSMGKLRMQKRNLNYTIGAFRCLEDEISPIQFNTLKRHMAYKRFNGELSGGVYGDNLEPDDWVLECEFDGKEILKELK